MKGHLGSPCVGSAGALEGCEGSLTDRVGCSFLDTGAKRGTPYLRSEETAE